MLGATHQEHFNNKFSDALDDVRKDSVDINESVYSLQDTVEFINLIPEKLFEIVLFIADKQFVENVKPILLLHNYVGESHQGAELKAALEKISVLRFLFHSASRYMKSELERLKTEFDVWVAKKKVEVTKELNDARKVLLESGGITKSNTIAPSHEIEATLLNVHGTEYLNRMEQIRKYETLYLNLNETADIIEKRGSHLQTLINSEIGMMRQPE